MALLSSWKQRKSISNKKRRLTRQSRDDPLVLSLRNLAKLWRWLGFYSRISNTSQRERPESTKMLNSLRLPELELELLTPPPPICNHVVTPVPVPEPHRGGKISDGKSEVECEALGGCGERWWMRSRHGDRFSPVLESQKLFTVKRYGTMEFRCGRKIRRLDLR
ncbi:hypothetical protein F2Q69_00053416 [Brassica cretica]|uniref:Uncharacterized protein n=1 Tax=Brassica cretica TaxID=69181 RepID=A0A8S9MX87_BRACR|nr:hypothetical protein F2Q69_00053416 [Brassica cretica]